MKRLLFFLLVSNFSFSQASIEIRLVDSNVGAPNYDLSQGYPIPMGTSNDAGLNAIFSTYNVASYEDNIPHPYAPYLQKTKVIFGSFSPQFITDLLSYSSVIESAKISNGYEFTDALILQLINASTGIPTGNNNNVITTNDDNLNTIFATYNVFYYTRTFPSGPVGNPLSRLYDVVCNCDKNILKTALDNYTSVIQTTENYNGGIQLSNNQFEKSSVQIYPNPFSNTFNIKTVETILNYSLTDISGKQIVTTSSKEELDTVTSQLFSGIYLINLQLENGNNLNYKLVKN